MRKLRNVLLAGAGIALLGGVAVAAGEKTHVLNVLMPDGAVAQVHYVGDVAPKLVVVPMTIRQADPFAAFADFNRISAVMDAQMRAMMHQVAALRAQATSGRQAVQTVSDGGQAPAGVQFSYVSTTTSSNGCTTSVRWSSDGSGAQPQMIKTSSGNCTNGSDRGGESAAMSKTAVPAAPANDAKVPGTSRT